MSEFHVDPSKGVTGRLTVPGDKSISHRALMLGAIADGTTHIEGFLESEDCLATLAALGHLGDQAQAAAAVQDLMKIKPSFSLDFARKQLFYLKRSDQIATYIQGLTNAGVK